jgi:hypothetical protein
MSNPVLAVSPDWSAALETIDDSLNHPSGANLLFQQYRAARPLAKDALVLALIAEVATSRIRAKVSKTIAGQINGLA